ncbi:protein BIC1-like [Actinidia eriantha]|uniref:protein BIC1-like n=1 Tax=Actinidia eriantha TaxID=165200 RepID=UPI002585304D|nr:protein BIC1-like [Actinidia eriantha]
MKQPPSTTTMSHNNPNESETDPTKSTHQAGGAEEALLKRPSSPSLVEEITSMPTSGTTEAAASLNGRERLKRHRVEVAGRVWIPDMWGQEELLKDWIDCTAFDASLVKSNIMSARAALVREGRLRASSSGLRIENRC